MTEIEGTDEFAAWFRALSEDEQDSVAVGVDLLEARGVLLDHPHSSQVKGTRKHKHMRELRIKHRGHPLRVLYAFDPRRVAITTPTSKSCKTKGGSVRWRRDRGRRSRTST